MSRVQLPISGKKSVGNGAGNSIRRPSECCKTESSRTLLNSLPGHHLKSAMRHQPYDGPLLCELEGYVDLSFGPHCQCPDAS